MVGWHHHFNGCEFEQMLEDGEGQGSLTYCSSWSHNKLDVTQRLNHSNKTAVPVVITKLSKFSFPPFYLWAIVCNCFLASYHKSCLNTIHQITWRIILLVSNSYFLSVFYLPLELVPSVFGVFFFFLTAPHLYYQLLYDSIGQVILSWKLTQSLSGSHINEEKFSLNVPNINGLFLKEFLNFSCNIKLFWKQTNIV